ncbi:MAG: alanine racemase [Planctomycetaceae bacterium]|nr:alanine racemase [Planctomycetaceae bacterium]
MGMKDLPHPSLHRTWVEIDLGAIRDNTAIYRSHIGPDRLLMPAIKADAYGHGAVRVARAVLEGGADRLAVATVLEGQRLREAGIGVPIQILGAAFPEEVSIAVRFNLTLSIHDIYIAQLIALAAVEADRVVPVQFKIDTGMGRLGILPENAVAAAREVASLPNLQFEGVFMHFADPGDDAYSRWQIAEFEKACAALEAAGVTGFLRHAANSAASFLYPEAHYDGIRPGCGIYGYQSPAWLADDYPLRPAMTWRSAVIQVKDYPPGRHLGYNRTFTTRRPTRVAVLPVGYADGFRREFSNRAEVLIRGRRAPVVGVVSMDYAMIDITGMVDVDVGTVATLLGEDRGDRITPEQLAEWGNTIPYCLTTGIGDRVGRLYGE